ncbi:MAG: M28 family peptidase [Phycisphaerales bacterium]|nr:M28 family peptidase [Planctomycetota bacterium]MCH8507355.1 M28 family peptidase [Phycisphaerales bacterium]
MTDSKSRFPQMLTPALAAWLFATGAALATLAEPASERPPVDPALVEFYQATVVELSHPSYEGRVPGSVGIDKAATLIEQHFRDLGLKPAFPVTETARDGTEVITRNARYRQHFEVGQQTRWTRTDMTLADAPPLRHGHDFTALAHTGDGTVTGPVVFTGYAIVSGPGGFRGFEDDADFEGQIALCLAYEPMDEQGNSLWDESGFSHHAALTQKASALIRRGAAGVIIVAPPHANDERVGMLETIDSSRMATPGGMPGRARRHDAPVVQVTPETAARILGDDRDPEVIFRELAARSNDGPVAEPISGPPVTIDIRTENRPIDAFNVGAILPGVGDLADEYVVIGGHYDHVGYGYFGSRARSRRGEIHPGADDNASGTAGVMVAAQTITERVRTMPPDQPRRTFLFMLFSAEEMGLLGSRHYVREPIAPVEQHFIMLNLDMIGRLEGKPLEIGSLNSAPAMPALADPHFEASGLPIAREASVSSGRSDHASFDAVGIPNLFFFTGLHPQYHTPDDTADLIDNEGGVRIALLAADIAMAAATKATPLPHRRTLARTAQQDAQPRVRVGVMPSNATRGGIIVERVFDDTSASEAGVRPNDRITAWNGQELRGMNDLRPHLVRHEPGDVITLTVDRDGETLEIPLTLRGIE